MAENSNPRGGARRGAPFVVTKADASASSSSYHLSSDVHSIGRVFGEESSQAEQSLREEERSSLRPDGSVDLATAQLRSMLAPSAEQLRNANLEIERLSRLLEVEMGRWQNQKLKLEEEIRILRRESKMIASASIVSPPPAAHKLLCVGPEAVSLATGQHYVLGLTGGPLEEATALLQRLGATVVDADEVALQVATKGSQLYNDLVNEFGPTVVLDRQTAEIRREGLDARRAAKFDKMMTAAVAAESVRLLSKARTHVVVYRASRLWESSVLCNAVIAVTCSRQEQMQRMRAANPGMSATEAAARVDSQPSQSAAAARATLVVDASSDELQSRITRLWSLIPQPGTDAVLAAGPCVATLTAVDATLPTCELFEGSDVVIGREAGCAIQVSDVTVSHRQCRVFVRDGKAWLDDLSTHGTFVNGAKVGHRLRVPLGHGDAVWLSKAAIKAKASPHWVVHISAQVETRTLQFPTLACGTAGSDTPKWIEKKRKTAPTRVLLNVRTGEARVADEKE